MSEEAETTGLRIAGFDVKGWWFAAALPVLSGISGTIYYGYDVVNRFWGVEESVAEVLDVVSRVQTLEQAIQDNDVRGLAPRALRPASTPSCKSTTPRSKTYGKPWMI